MGSPERDKGCDRAVPGGGRLRRRRPHLGKRGRLGGAAPQLLGPEEGKWLSFPSFLTPTPHRVVGGGVGWVGSLRAGWVANTPRPVQSDCVGSTLSSLAPFRSPATQPKCGAGQGSCSSKESQYRYYFVYIKREECVKIL